MKSQDLFRKKQTGIKWIYRLHFLNYVDYKVELQMAIRIDEMEKIFHRTSGYEKKYQSSSVGLLMLAQYCVGAQGAATVSARHSLCPKTTLYSAGVNKSCPSPTTPLPSSL